MGCATFVRLAESSSRLDGGHVWVVTQSEKWLGVILGSSDEGTNAIDMVDASPQTTSLIVR